MKTYCKLQQVCFVLVLCLNMLCVTVKADTAGIFPDVPLGASYAEAVEVLAELGIFYGDDQGNFNPDSSITRAEAAAVICRLLGVEEEAKSMTQQVFSDVPSSHWAVGNIAKASELGIVAGYGNGNYGPSDPLTQEQIIKMLVCAWGYDGEAQRSGGYPSGYIAVAQELGITDGVNISRTGLAPRSVVAQFAYNTLQIGQFEDEEMYECQEW